MSSALIGISSCVNVHVRHLYIHAQPGNLCLHISTVFHQSVERVVAIICMKILLHKNIVRWAGIEQNLLAVCAGAGENHLTWAAYIT